jgi:hypothetical protein
MNLRIDHHQHQIVDLVIAKAGSQRFFNRADGFVHFGKCRGWKIAETVCFAAGGKDQGAERRLLRPQQDQPVPEFGNYAVGIPNVRMVALIPSPDLFASVLDTGDEPGSCRNRVRSRVTAWRAEEAGALETVARRCEASTST